MELSRKARVLIMLTFSVILFFLELVIGLISGSIALVADSFHMLNDVMSLVIAFYAIELSAKKGQHPKNTYGWQRSEILGALMNAILLLGLSLTIYIESIQRFFEIVEIKNPKLVLIVGAIGLTFNIFGMLLFGDSHGHSHGHSHHDHAHEHIHEDLEQALTDGRASSLGMKGQKNADTQRLLLGAPGQPGYNINASTSNSGNQVYTFENDLSREDELRPQTDYPPVTQVAILESAEMLKKYSSGAYDLNELNKFEDHPPLASDTKSLHRDQKSKVGGESGHLNMYGVWLHVFGDCLANIAVICSALFIWLTDYSWKYYMDPIVSLIINTIIVLLTIPLVRSTSFILMQGVPPAINVKRLHQELRNIEGVSNVHELHVWQLSDTKTVASVHLHIQRPKLSKLKANANSKSSTDISKIYMTVAKQANDILHRYGVHSTTIQPEFLFAEFFGDDISSASENAGYLDLNNQKRGDSRKISAKSTIGGASIKSVLQNIDTSAQACLLRCQDGACAASECCDFLASDSEDHHTH